MCALINCKHVFLFFKENTVADCVCDLATDLQQQLMGKGKDLIAYSLAVDESSGTSDTAQLSIFIRGVDSTLYVVDERLGFKSMHDTTTGKDVFEEVSKCVNEMGLPWDKFVGLTTDVATAMCRKERYKKRMKKYILFFSINTEYVRPSTWTRSYILALCVFEFDTPDLLGKLFCCSCTP